MKKRKDGRYVKRITFEDGCANRFELSEYFGVPEDFMQKALDYYFEL